MPQIWMTYAELGGLLDLSPGMARNHVIQEGWARRRSRDGLTRVKLDSRAISLFLDMALAERSAALREPVNPVHAMQEHLAVFGASPSSIPLISLDKELSSAWAA